MTELFNKIDAKLNTINYITKSPTIERNVTKIKKYISKLKRIVEETNDAITNVSGYNEELLDKIADQKFEINELKEENAEIIVRLNDLENENIGLKSRQINVERRRKKKNKRKTKHKHKKRHITEFCNEIVDLYDEIANSNNKISLRDDKLTVLSKCNEELKDCIDENNRNVNCQKIVKNLKRKNYLTYINKKQTTEIELEIKTDFNYNKLINQNNLLEFTKHLQQQNDMYIVNNKRVITRKLRYTSDDKESLSKQNYDKVNNNYFKHTISHIVDNFDEDTINNVDFNKFNYMVIPDTLVISYI